MGFKELMEEARIAREEKKMAKLEEKRNKEELFKKIMSSNPEVSNKENTTSSMAINSKLVSNDSTKTYNKPVIKEEKQVCCPKCGSNQLTANKKGFSLVKGAVGVLALNAYGVVAAGHGKNKIIITCLNCGKQFKPGQGK